MGSNSVVAVEAGLCLCKIKLCLCALQSLQRLQHYVPCTSTDAWVCIGLLHKCLQPPVGSEFEVGTVNVTADQHRCDGVALPCCCMSCPQELIYGSSEVPTAVGVLADPSKPLLFTMARLDRVKNLTGLVEW